MSVPIVVLTAVLVLVTAYYAWQTRRAVQTSERALRLGLVPLVVPRGEFDHEPLSEPTPRAELGLYNAGPGSAFEVSVEAGFQNYLLAGRLEVLGPRECVPVSLEVMSNERLYSMSDSSDFDLFVDLTFQDGLGREFHTVGSWVYARGDAPRHYWYNVKVEGPDLLR